MAIEAEYKIFASNKVVTTYRRSMAFLMAEVKKSTDAWELHSVLSGFNPNADPCDDSTLQSSFPNNKISKCVIIEPLVIFLSKPRYEFLA